MSAPLIMVAPNGARRGKPDHPSLPIRTDEILAEAIACHRAGAGALHLHVRDGEGRHSLDAGRYREALQEIAQAAPALALQITTESADLYGPDAQYECLEKVKPEWASISVREIARDADLAPSLYALCADQGTRVQHIAYDIRDLELFTQWRSNGIVQADQDEVICVLGAYAPPRAGSPEDLVRLLPGLASLRFAVCAFGPSEQTCLVDAAHRGAEILRVGFENNLTAPDGKFWTNNAAAVSSLRTSLERSAA